VRSVAVDAAGITDARRGEVLSLGLEHLRDVRRASRNLPAAAETQRIDDTPVDQGLVGAYAALVLVVRVAIAELELQMLDAPLASHERQQYLAVDLVDRGLALRAACRELQGVIEHAFLRLQRIDDVDVRVVPVMKADGEAGLPRRQLRQAALQVRLEELLIHFGLVVHLDVDGLEAVLRDLVVRPEDGHAGRAGGEAAGEAVT